MKVTAKEVFEKQAEGAVEEEVSWAYRQMLSALGYLEVELRAAQTPEAQQLAKSIEYYIPKRIKSALAHLAKAFPHLSGEGSEDYSTWMR